MGNPSTLVVWHRANAFSVAVHRAARRFPSRGAPGLRAQLLRAAASIPANIAEGAGHETDTQFAHFLTIAIGSANEAETHLALAHGLNFLPDAQFQNLTEELRSIRRMLYGLKKHLQRSS